ncbi:hypothetical protein [Streptomyces sp. NBC_00470]|uniref:hypothetical protein n=1 Tax=Streptomyces sp. NBC_00470 TaxID=2975753 RepID=UPI002F918C0C
MGNQLSFEGDVKFDRPVSPSGPEDEDILSDLTSFLPLVEYVGPTAERRITGFRADEDAYAKHWDGPFAQIELFMSRHQVTPTSTLEWSGDDGEPDDNQGTVVFDPYGHHHLVTVNDGRERGGAEQHLRNACGCYPDIQPDSEPDTAPTPQAKPEVDGPVGPVKPVDLGQGTEYAADCDVHGRIVLTADEQLARAVRAEHAARHHS